MVAMRSCRSMTPPLVVLPVVRLEAWIGRSAVTSAPQFGPLSVMVTSCLGLVPRSMLRGPILGGQYSYRRTSRNSSLPQVTVSTAQQGERKGARVAAKRAGFYRLRWTLDILSVQYLDLQTCRVTWPFRT
jgi:hypothetical protein